MFVTVQVATRVLTAARSMPARVPRASTGALVAQVVPAHLHARAALATRVPLVKLTIRVW